MIQKGESDSDIKEELRKERIPPKRIQEIINQAKVKGAVSKEEDNMANNNYDQQQRNSSGQQMSSPPQPEQNQQNPSEQDNQQYYQPQPAQPSSGQQYSQQPQMPQQETYQQQYYPQEQGNYDYQENYDYSGYDQGGGYGGNYGDVNSDLVIEIADQVFTDKIAKFEKQLNETTKKAELNESKLDDVNQRLKKIEKLIDELQVKILEKVGSYGNTMNNIKKEMSMMQDSFSKALNPLLDKEKETNKKSSSKSKKKSSKSKK